MQKAFARKGGANNRGSIQHHDKGYYLVHRGGANKAGKDAESGTVRGGSQEQGNRRRGFRVTREMGGTCRGKNGHLGQCMIYHTYDNRREQRAILTGNADQSHRSEGKRKFQKGNFECKKLRGVKRATKGTLSTTEEENRHEVKLVAD